MKTRSKTYAPFHRRLLADPLSCHLLPFVLWLVLMALPGDPSALKYAIRTLLTGALLLYLRPWRWYAAPRLSHVLPGTAVGLVVFAMWVAPESEIAAGVPALQDAYLRFGITPFSQFLQPPSTISPYAPELCGWPLTLIRIIGSTMVIALAEELFWRGCLYRTLIDRDFVKVDLGRYHALAFGFICIAFGLEHQRWFVGILAGAAYALLMLKTRSLWPPILAHGTTNLLLGVYVVAGDHYAFWS